MMNDPEKQGYRESEQFQFAYEGEKSIIVTPVGEKAITPSPFANTECRAKISRRIRRTPFTHDKLLRSIRAQCRNSRARAEVMNHYGGACAICGESNWDLLTVEHPNGDGAEHRKSWNMVRGGGNTIYVRLVKLKFQVKWRLELLCPNCQKRRVLAMNEAQRYADFEEFGLTPVVPQKVVDLKPASVPQLISTNEAMENSRVVDSSDVDFGVDPLRPVVDRGLIVSSAGHYSLPGDRPGVCPPFSLTRTERTKEL